MVNPTAGRFRAPRIAEEVRQLGGNHGLDIFVYETSPDKLDRILDLGNRLREINPSESNPVGLLALGGDGTVNDMVVGVMTYLFPNLTDYVQGSPEDVATTMLASGIWMGTSAMGGANDLAMLYGAPRPVPLRLVHFMQQATTVPLNLGIGFLDDGPPVLFAHTLSGGVAIAPVYEETVDERGMAARRHRQWLGFEKVVLHPQSVSVQWEGGQEESTFEVIAHATRRADGMNGFPGAPFPGIGIKVLPNWGRANTARMFSEVVFRGLVSRAGWTSLLMREGGLRSLPPSHQQALVVGEEMGFIFEEPVAVQGCGDFLHRASQLKVKAGVPFPRSLSHRSSTMAQIAHRMGGPRLLGSPAGPRLLLWSK